MFICCIFTLLWLCVYFQYFHSTIDHIIEKHTFWFSKHVPSSYLLNVQLCLTLVVWNMHHNWANIICRWTTWSNKSSTQWTSHGDVASELRRGTTLESLMDHKSSKCSGGNFKMCISMRSTKTPICWWDVIDGSKRANQFTWGCFSLT